VIEGSCHCGAVRYRVAAAPETVTSCNCSICRRLGGLWAYYSPRDVRVEGPTAIYMSGDRCLRLHRCETCGCVTHWSPVDESADRMGVNARLMAPEVLAAARVRHFDGAETWKYLDE
jgi:hypothetical protein